MITVGKSVRALVFAAACLLLLSLVAPGCARREPPVAQQPSKPAAQPPAKPGRAQVTPSTLTNTQLAAGQKLFNNHCAACHGEKGDGNGPAAVFTFPKPRNFRKANFRLVTTQNRVPSDDDLMRVITRGMPGSAMLPFAHLSEADRKSLVAYVRHLTRSGMEEVLRKLAADAGEDVDPAELQKDIDRRTAPAETIKLPSDFPPSTAESAARGRTLYLAQCAACHGEYGRGDGQEKQFDDEGFPTSPRDYTRGIFKGGHEPEQLYARMMLGMPGTPMPEYTKLQPTEIADLINFVLSLSDPSAQANVEHRRTLLVVGRAGRAISDDTSDPHWKSAPSVRITVSPLWWRNYDEPDLTVQALHDGSSLAIRLSWHDKTRDQHSVRPQDFEDMVAVQLFKGNPEPFLGMGATTGMVDVWLWRAGWQADRVAYADVDTTYPDMAVDIYPFEQPGIDSRRHATQRQPKEFITGWAAGNLQSDPTRTAAASGLQAKGFGTLTMLPRVSQLVSGKGQWSDGQWTVVLRRPLQTSADAGLALAPGDKLSIAFAVWDGASRDRNGQKLISIWHDLELK